MDAGQTLTLHASCVAIDGAGILIVGASGTGKSTLALQLMALGASLVADDRTELTRIDTRISARAPVPLHGLIEARGVGILRALPLEKASLNVVIDLDTPEHERLPHMHHARILDTELPCLHKVEGPHFPAAISQYVRCGRRDPS